MRGSEISSWGRDPDQDKDVEPPADSERIRPELVVTVIPVLDQQGVADIGEQVYAVVKDAALRGMAAAAAEFTPPPAT